MLDDKSKNDLIKGGGNCVRFGRLKGDEVPIPKITRGVPGAKYQGEKKKELRTREISRGNHARVWEREDKGGRRRLSGEI